jgi:excisionase family DNA binding protein
MVTATAIPICTDPAVLEDTMSVAEAAAVLTCSDLTVRRRIAQGRLVAVRNGPKFVRITRASVEGELNGAER